VSAAGAEPRARSAQASDVPQAPQPRRAPLLAVERLVKHFPIRAGVFSRTTGVVRAVDDVSFAIASGETLGLVGESGSGKSTTGRLILRLLPATSGRVRFDGREVFDLDARSLRLLRREMQIVFQDPYSSLNPRMRIGDAIAEPIAVHRLAARREIPERVASLLTRVGLSPDHARRYPHEFSGGQRQRIGIARALALGPRFIVCDEPVSALDVSIQAQILNLLADLQRDLGLTYLFIAHDLAVVRHISSRVAVMYLGRIVEEASTEEIFENPLHPYTRALLASVPAPDPKARQRSAPGGASEAARPAALPEGCAFHPRCPMAAPECRAGIPALEEVRPGHRVACIRAEEPGS
jgi:oligopeptide/dipeptide ABC transporter ATP-binding protein